jgi:3-hydroxypropanoate dehydrogenase
VRSPQARERLVTHMSQGNKAKTSTAPLVAVLAVDSQFHENLPTIFPVAPAMKDSYTEESRRLEVATPQAWLQAGYFIIGIRALGLAAGPMLGFNRSTLDEDLLAGTGWRSIAVVNIGRPGPDAWRDRLPRLDLTEVSRTI